MLNTERKNKQIAKMILVDVVSRETSYQGIIEKALSHNSNVNGKLNGYILEEFNLNYAPRSEKPQKKMVIMQHAMKNETKQKCKEMVRQAKTIKGYHKHHAYNSRQFIVIITEKPFDKILKELNEVTNLEFSFHECKALGEKMW